MTKNSFLRKIVKTKLKIILSMVIYIGYIYSQETSIIIKHSLVSSGFWFLNSGRQDKVRYQTYRFNRQQIEYSICNEVPSVDVCLQNINVHTVFYLI